MTDTILLCTVGGSSDPIIKAIQDIQRSDSLSFVCFFCSGIDKITGNKGSRKEVEGKDGIAAKAGLSNGQFGICEISPDSLDDCFTNIHAETINLRQKYPSSYLVANYTGGTKTMSAALVCAALEHDNVGLTLTTGPRDNLEHVQSGTEGSVNINIKEVQIQRKISKCLASWQRFNYHEAEEGLRTISREISTDSRNYPIVLLSREMSRAFRLVDNFNYSDALKILDHHSKFISRHYPNMLPSMRLCSQEGNPLSEPVKLFYLWHGAKRRATQGRFDDAVGRWYRMIEWTAQWQLKIKRGVDTGNLSEDLLPPNTQPNRSANGKIRAGLWQAWMVVKHHLNGPASDFVSREGDVLLGYLEVRNQSILAHGCTPVDEGEWHEICSWTEKSFLPTLKELAAEAGLKQMPDQLPDRPPESWNA